MKIIDTVQRAFGESDDHEQAIFLNQLGYSLLEACKFDHNKVEGQLCYVSAKLDKNGRKLVQQLAEFLRLRDEEGSPNNGLEG